MVAKEISFVPSDVSGKTVSTLEEITKKEPQKSLVAPLPKSAGRNFSGKITTYHRGGAHKRLYRIIDFKRDKIGTPARVVSIEYDPNRKAKIALLQYADGEKRYIIAPLGLRVNEVVMAGPEAEIRPGNALPLKNIPVGSLIHNIELFPGKGGQICRTAGAGAQVLAKEEAYAQVKLPSGEIRRFRLECMAVIGQVGNVDNKNISLGKAGRSRWLGIRPHVRGTAMNPVDHPHGGGKGKSKGGNIPSTPWGMPTRGYKTRRKKPSDKLIVKRRK